MSPVAGSTTADGGSADSPSTAGADPDSSPRRDSSTTVRANAWRMVVRKFGSREGTAHPAYSDQARGRNKWQKSLEEQGYGAVDGGRRPGLSNARWLTGAPYVSNRSRPTPRGEEGGHASRRAGVCHLAR